jgi:hypothetical protein
MNHVLVGRGPRRRAGVALVAAGLIAAGVPAGLASAHDTAHDAANDTAHDTGVVTTVRGGLVSPRGLAVVDDDEFIVARANGVFSKITENDGTTTLTRLGRVPKGFIAPAVDTGRHGAVFVLTPEGPPGTGAATLYRWKKGQAAPTKVADIGKYQLSDPDPDNLADPPGESNPFGVAALRDGSVLVSDAAANDLLRVYPGGKVVTVARLKPRVVTVPKNLPREVPGPTGEPIAIRKAGQKMRAEAVATSVTVGSDGWWYVGELRGVPATPKTSQVWRIKAGSRDAVCDPRHPHQGACTRYADGFTSIVDLAADDDGGIYVSELSKKSWLKWELGRKHAMIGGLFRISSDGDVEELAAGRLKLPGNVDVRGDHVFVTTPVFGPGALVEVND